MTHFDILAVFWLSWMCSQRVLRSKKNVFAHTKRENTQKNKKYRTFFLSVIISMAAGDVFLKSKIWLKKIHC